MGQFKPMVKMETTEPSVILKLKKGGSVAHKKMKNGGGCSDHKPMQKMMDGGVMEVLAAQPALVGGSSGSVAPVARPKKPSMAARRMAMMRGLKKGKRPIKEGGDVEKELKAHEAKPASKAHAGLKKGGACYKDGGIIKSTSGKSTISTAEHTTKTSGKTGDVKKGNGGGYKTGGVVLGNGGGYKAGGKACATGGVALGNAGGYKKGGASKKAYANGGSVQNEGKAVSMSQGNKKPSSPVSISKLSGTFKNGGNVKKMASGGNTQAKVGRTIPTISSAVLSQPRPNLTNLGKVYASGMDKKTTSGVNKFNPGIGGKVSLRGMAKKFVGGGHAKGDTSDNVSDLAYESVMKAEKSGKKTMIDPKEGSVTESEREVVRKTMPTEKKYPSGMTDKEIDDFLRQDLMRRLYERHIDKKDGGKVGK